MKKNVHLDQKSIKDIEKKIGYEFKNPDLLRQALTHISYANEHSLPSYERLEFMGDAILGFIVSKALFSLNASDKEGSLTKKRASFVRKEALIASFDRIGITNYVLMGNGQDINSDSKIYADVFESLIAAIYLDSNMMSATKFVQRFIIDVKSDNVKDYKTELQEYVQRRRGNTLKYEVIKTAGTPNNPLFSSRVIINGKEYAIGQGHTKKLSEMAAAKIALELLKKENIK